MDAAGIKTAHVLAAVTGEDEANLVVTTLARFEFNVPRTIALVNNPKNAWLFTLEMGVDVALNQTDILAGLIVEEMSMGDMMTLLKLRRGLYSLVEEKLAPWIENAQHSVERSSPSGYLRDCSRDSKRTGCYATRQLVFEVGDEVLAVVNNESKEILRDLCQIFESM
jgi:trk system potassium uptake protein